MLQPIVMARSLIFLNFRDSSKQAVSPSETFKRPKVGILLLFPSVCLLWNKNPSNYICSITVNACNVTWYWIALWRRLFSLSCNSANFCVWSFVFLFSSLFTRKAQLKQNKLREQATTKSLLKAALWNMKRTTKPTSWGKRKILMNWKRKTRNQWAQRTLWVIYMTKVSDSHVLISLPIKCVKHGASFRRLPNKMAEEMSFVKLFKYLATCPLLYFNNLHFSRE